MQAQHPITGKPIRIMKTETHLYKNLKTIAKLDGVQLDAKFQRFDTAVFSVAEAERWKSSLGTYPSAIVLKHTTAETLLWLKDHAPRQREILFLSKELMDAYGGAEAFQAQKFSNVLCLEELGHLYPQILQTYTPEESDDTTFLTIAVVFRASRVMANWSEGSTEYAEKLADTYTIHAEPLTLPEPLVLIQQYYEPAKPKRGRELKFCLEKNLECSYIDQILLLNEEDLSAKLPTSPKLKQVVIGHRLTYADVIQAIQEHVDPSAIVVFANSDIHLTPSWQSIWSVNLKDVFLSLLRYEQPTSPEEEPQLFGPRPDSQDTWVLRADSVKSRTWILESLNFPFGKAGCDNAINVEMMRQKFIVANPALSLQTIHVHGSGFRTYNPEDVVDKPLFLYLDPTGLHDLEPKTHLNLSQINLFPTQRPFTRQIKSSREKDAKTFCAMMSKGEVHTLESNSENLYTPRTEKTYKFDNAFVTPNGLVYGYKSIYMSPETHVRELWADTRISPITPCLGIKSAVAIHLSDEVASSALTYMTQYLSRVLRLRTAGRKGEFWLPRTTKHLQEFLQHFQWEEQTLPVIPREDGIATFAEQVTWVLPNKVNLLSQEDVEALRNALRGYESSIRSMKRVVIAQDDTGGLPAELVLALETALEAKGYEVEVVYPSRSSPGYLLQRLLGASALIGTQLAENLLWLLPRGAKVIDWMSELKIEGTMFHTAGACGLDYWITLYPRAKPDALQRMLVERVLESLGHVERVTAPEPTVKDTSKPVVIVPKNFKGFHDHAGDTFREMVDIWQERGLVTVQYSSKTPFVWLNTIGDTLLYDRPTKQWYDLENPSAKRILCGNPSPDDFPNGRPWTFWPRRPRLVEERVSKSLPTWSERTKTLVFYGRVENAVQRERRSNELYKACDEFDCPDNSVSYYKYGPTEYLDQLALSKYGFCMSGFGYKCNREIECIALGTVPVCAPDVDMEHYANPPQAGVHYIRLKSYDPEEAKHVVDAIPQEHWEAMSKACREWWEQNASAEGMLALTLELAKG